MIALFLILIQSFLLAVHLFIGSRLDAWGAIPFFGVSWRLLFGTLSFAFPLFTFLIHNKKRPQWLEFLYIGSSLWLGIINVLFCLTLGAALLFQFGFGEYRTLIANSLLLVSSLITMRGLLNVRRLETTAYPVALKKLPPAWEGKKLVFISDLHLGAIWGRPRMSRIVDQIKQSNPEAVFLIGDIFDGPPADYTDLSSPLSELRPRLGCYFVNGNHESYRLNDPYTSALETHGVTILRDEVRDLEGIDLVGADYLTTTSARTYQQVLDRLSIRTDRPSILLKHIPTHIPQVVAKGISLQLSGHTHGGQLWPFPLFTHLIFRGFDRGLRREKGLQVITSDGAGTWGPPIRLGTRCEIVEITLHLDPSP
ncbi:metallophosphoesterase [Patescibacteria group bacterium]|nr:metallophosphoesterase [Patescibacteria group bacterium]